MSEIMDSNSSRAVISGTDPPVFSAICSSNCRLEKRAELASQQFIYPSVSAIPITSPLGPGLRLWRYRRQHLEELSGETSGKSDKGSAKRSTR